MMGTTAGPTLLGFDVLWVATILSGIAAFAVMLAIYAVTTVNDLQDGPGDAVAGGKGKSLMGKFGGLKGLIAKRSAKAKAK